jgi:hypothetical protein
MSSSPASPPDVERDVVRVDASKPAGASRLARCSAAAGLGTPREALKLLALLAALGALVFAGRKVGGLIKAVRAQLQTVSLPLMVSIFVAVTAVRKLCPPVYFLFPVGALFSMYLVDKVGPTDGALVYQLVKLQDLAYFVLLPRLYGRAVAGVFDDAGDDAGGDAGSSAGHKAGGQAAGPAAESKWMPARVQAVLRELDGTWRAHTLGRPRARQGALVVAFSVCFYMEDYVSLLWLSMRAGIAPATFAASFTVALVIEYPKTVIKLTTYRGLLDTAEAAVKARSGSAASSVWDFSHMTTVEVVFGVAVPLLATAYVHGTHVLLAARAARAGWRARWHGGGKQNKPASCPRLLRAGGGEAAAAAAAAVPGAVSATAAPVAAPAPSAGGVEVGIEMRDTRQQQQGGADLELTQSSRFEQGVGHI